MTIEDMRADIRLIILDDHEGIRLGHAAYFARYPSIKVVASLDNAAELEKKIAETRANLLLMDISMPGFNAVNCVIGLKRKFPQLRILAVSAFAKRAYVTGLIKAGIDGYCLKPEPLATLSKAVQLVVRGEKWFSHEVSMLATGYLQNVETLTERELEVLKLIANGTNTEKIADELYISTRTIQSHLKNIFQKLSVNSRAEAVAKAIRMGIIPDVEVANP